ncbi:hypothetical protein AB0M45_16965 [Nocardia sp. NPDC051787]|uniref:hypothetical protein n=1 Tax=Nocardia sp. NPDC051787 TaxID=3155415 RepID=UPI00343088A7
MAGELTVHVADQRVEVSTGSTVFAPRGLPHADRVDSEVCRFLTLITPGGFEHWFTETGRPAESLSLPPVPASPTSPSSPPQPPAMASKSWALRRGLQRAPDPSGRNTAVFHPSNSTRFERRNRRPARTRKEYPCVSSSSEQTVPPAAC